MGVLSPLLINFWCEEHVARETLIIDNTFTNWISYYMSAILPAIPERKEIIITTTWIFHSVVSILNIFCYKLHVLVAYCKLTAKQSCKCKCTKN